MNYIERIALEILQRKYYHVFLFGEYFRSFYHKEPAECYLTCYPKDCKLIQLKGGR